MLSVFAENISRPGRARAGPFPAARYIGRVRRITIITGPRDSGKTRCVVSLAGALQAAGTSVGGVIAEADIREGRKAGYAFRDLMSGDRIPYAVASVRAPGEPEPVGGTGRGYVFLDAGLAFGRLAITRAVEARVAVLIVDEIGPLEMKGEGLWDAVSAAAAFHAGSMVLTTRPSLVESLCAKLVVSDEDVRVVTPADKSSFGLGGLSLLE